MRKNRRKKLLPVETPEANVLRSVLRRLAKDIEILERMPTAAKDAKYPLEDLQAGALWLEWLEREKRNEEKRLAREVGDDPEGEDGNDGKTTPEGASASITVLR